MSTVDPSELERAHARIAILEQMLGTTPEPPRPRPWTIVVRWLALAAAIALIVAAVVASLAPRPEVIAHAAPPPPPAPMPAGELELFTPRYVWDTDGPVLVDGLDKGSARDSLLLLAWRRGHADRPLHVVALRRDTYEVLWKSAGFPSRRTNTTDSLVATGGMIAVKDSLDTVHVLDVHTGVELRTVQVPPTERLATLPSDPEAAFTVRPFSSSPSSDSTTYRIELGSGMIAATELPAKRFLYECEVARSRACRAEPLATEKAKLNALGSPRAAEFGEDLVDGDDWITVFDTAPRPQLVDFQLFAWKTEPRGSGSAPELSWRAPAVPRPRQALQSSGSGSHHWLALANHRVVAVYLVGREGHRISAHDAATGKSTYDVALPELPYGIEVERLTLEGDVGFITTSGALFVLDATTGKVTTTLRHF